MRTTLLVPLLIVFLGWTLLSILILRIIVEQQTRNELASDLSHSISTYQNLQRQHHGLMLRQAALIADLPTIKALMTSNDRHTIQDGSAGFWHTSDSDLFALFDANLNLSAAYRRGGALPDATLEQALSDHLKSGEDHFYVVLGGILYEIAVQPIIFGDHTSGTLLGYLLVGYALDSQVARQVSEAAAAEVLFSNGNTYLAGTLSPALHDQLIADLPHIQSTGNAQTIRLDGQRYLATALPLEPGAPGVPAPHLVVLKSFQQGQALIRRVNRWVATLSILVVCAGMIILLSVSRSITRPINSLMHGVRAMTGGDYTYSLEVKGGAEEIRELSRSFDRMRAQLDQSRKELVQSERLATIGRMASSISHDLRHHLSAMYANAEFMCNPALPQTEREELLTEVRTAVHDMTDLLESLLLFSQTGKALQCVTETMSTVLKRSINTIRSHPAAHNVSLSLDAPSNIQGYVDTRKLGRAIYNLLLNACEAAQRSPSPAVHVQLTQDENMIYIRIIDNGPGVSESVRKTMFLPFVSEGKQSGTGLGLTLAEHIASEHGGAIAFERTDDHLTIFSLVLPRNTWPDPPGSQEGSNEDISKVTQ
ncbi:HAMP domain-containing sensor histidine kinase [Edaphobacter sp. 12200R-103]|uniref:sensor histidine kinase n=1 Tax=Edaphobacter sp. 12200R-103 TaxID=2703788 RepID=UPI00138C3924|nr:HAMP domain-containing sensor histidine kinase [Edaphobacter sp. 12200R-103]QHS51761.1 HAMP domain-containing protein [Edaphobacter sp. 12200R-103]